MATRCMPTELLMNQRLTSHLDLLRPDLQKKVSEPSKLQPTAPKRQLSVGDRDYKTPGLQEEPRSLGQGSGGCKVRTCDLSCNKVCLLLLLLSLSHLLGTLYASTPNHLLVHALPYFSAVSSLPPSILTASFKFFSQTVLHHCIPQDKCYEYTHLHPFRALPSPS